MAYLCGRGAAAAAARVSAPGGRRSAAALFSRNNVAHYSRVLQGNVNCGGRGDGKFECARWRSARLEEAVWQKRRRVAGWCAAVIA